MLILPGLPHQHLASFVLHAIHFITIVRRFVRSGSFVRRNDAHNRDVRSASCSSVQLLSPEFGFVKASDVRRPILIPSSNVSSRQVLSSVGLLVPSWSLKMAVSMGSAAPAPWCMRLQQASGDGGVSAASCVRVAAGARAVVVGSVPRAVLGGSRGAGVLERPKLDQSGSDNTPMTEEGGESGKEKDRVRTGGGDRYRVLLLDADHHTETFVEKTLPKAVPGVTLEHARKCYMEAKLVGKSVVMVAVKEHAEMHSYCMARFRLRATIEPDVTTV